MEKKNAILVNNMSQKRFSRRINQMIAIVTWILSATCCVATVMAACSGRTKKNTEQIEKLPINWPCEWDNGRIPYVFDYYSINLKRLIGMVHKGLKFLESYACLTFHEKNPIKMAHGYNVTYLYFTYSSVLEECCAAFFEDGARRRVASPSPNNTTAFIPFVACYDFHWKTWSGTILNRNQVVLITPICRNRAEVAHATLHALGLTHSRLRGASFGRDAVDAVMFPDDCSTSF